MKTRKKKTIEAPAIADGQAADVLARARRILYGLTATGAEIDAAAAEAVTKYRHGEQGRRFSEQIMQAVKTQGEAAINRVITKALLKPKPLF